MDQVETIGRMLLALAAVLFVVWVLARVVRRTRAGSTALLDVLGRKQLSKSASIAVVRVGDRTVLVGVTDGQVSLLGDVDLPTTTGVDAPAAAPAPVLPAVAPGAVTPIRRAAAAPTRTGGALAGSALSPATWRQSVDALRDLTVRSRVG